MNFLGTHDTPRILSVLSDLDYAGKSNRELSTLRLSPSEREIATKRLVALYTVIATLPGIPSVFYGDEAGLEGFNDPFNRMPYPYGNVDDSLLSHYRKIGNVRLENNAYKASKFNLIHLDENVFVFERYDSRWSYITVLNVSESEYSLSNEAKFLDLISNEKSKCFTIKPISAGIFKIKRNFTLDLRRN
jgi:4-alpha-glucanotransferase